MTIQRRMTLISVLIVICATVGGVLAWSQFDVQLQRQSASIVLSAQMRDSSVVVYREVTDELQEIEVNARYLAESPAVQAALASGRASTVQDDVLEPLRRTAGLTFISLIAAKPARQIAQARVLSPAGVAYIFSTYYALQYQQDSQQIWDGPAMQLPHPPYLVAAAPVQFNGHAVGVVVAGRVVDSGFLGMLSQAVARGDLVLSERGSVVAASPRLAGALRHDHAVFPVSIDGIQPWQGVSLADPMRAEQWILAGRSFSTVVRPLGFGSQAKLAIAVPTPQAPNAALLRVSAGVDFIGVHLGLPVAGDTTFGLLVTRTVVVVLIVALACALLPLASRLSWTPLNVLMQQVATYLDTQQWSWPRSDPKTDVGGLGHLVERLVSTAESWRLEARQKSDRLQRILDGMNAGVVISDKRGTIEFINPVARELLGLDVYASLPTTLSPAELLNQPVQGTNGRTITATSAPIVSAGGETEGLVTVLTDVSREQELERVRSDFLTVVSHELRTPLTAIKGALDLVLEGATGELDPVAQRFLLTARRNTERLITVVNDLLDLSRIEAGQVQLHIQSFDVRRVITDVLATLETITERRHQEVSLDLPGQPVPVQADRRRLEQILTNLLANASQYTPYEGRIEVGAEGQTTGETVTLRVWNSGPGIAVEDLPHLFEKFYRGGNALTREEGGSGLGLAIVKSLVDLHHGTISVTSEQGRFTEFTLILPGKASDEGARS